MKQSIATCFLMIGCFFTICSANFQCNTTITVCDDFNDCFFNLQENNINCSCDFEFIQFDFPLCPGNNMSICNFSIDICDDQDNCRSLNQSNGICFCINQTLALAPSVCIDENPCNVCDKGSTECSSVGDGFSCECKPGFVRFNNTMCVVSLPPVCSNDGQCNAPYGSCVTISSISSQCLCTWGVEGITCDDATKLIVTVTFVSGGGVIVLSIGGYAVYSYNYEDLLRCLRCLNPCNRRRRNQRNERYRED